VDIDQDKIGKDVKKGADKVKDAIDKNTTSDPARRRTRSRSGGHQSGRRVRPVDPKGMSVPERQEKVAEGVARPDHRRLVADKNSGIGLRLHSLRTRVRKASPGALLRALRAKTGIKSVLAPESVAY